MTDGTANRVAAERATTRFWEWLTRRKALASARAFRHELPPVEREALQRALLAKELGDRALDPVDPLRHGPGVALALSLYREAAYWALLAHNGALTAPTLEQLFAQATPESLAQAAGGSQALAEVRASLVDRTFVDTARRPTELLPNEASLAKEFVGALLTRKLAPEARISKLLFQRYLRCLTLAAVVLGAALGARYGVDYSGRGPDLAAGKPWRASSSPDTCHPAQRRCAGVSTGMFFTTSEEVDPWLVIDLGKSTRFNQIEVVNRDDCCPDRAVPLLVEVGNDQKHWREVSRRTETFAVWTARFATQEARYVRLHVPRRTVFHLNKVALRHVR